MKVTATDSDEKTADGDGYGDVGYFLTHEFFKIDQKTGEISVKKALDRETSTEYSFMVTAEDGGGKKLTGERFNDAKVEVTIKIDDVNDNAPIFLPAPSEISILENAKVGEAAKIFQVRDLDEGKNGEVTFEVTGDGAKFFGVRAEIDPASPAGVTWTNAVLYPKIPLDYETKNIHSLKIKARSSQAYEGIKKESIIEPEIDLLVRIGNVNEPPKFEKDVFLFEG